MNKKETQVNVTIKDHMTSSVYQAMADEAKKEEFAQYLAKMDITLNGQEDCFEGNLTLDDYKKELESADKSLLIKEEKDLLSEIGGIIEIIDQTVPSWRKTSGLGPGDSEHETMLCIAEDDYLGYLKLYFGRLLALREKLGK